MVCFSRRPYATDIEINGEPTISISFFHFSRNESNRSSCCSRAMKMLLKSKTSLSSCGVRRIICSASHYIEALLYTASQHTNRGDSASCFFDNDKPLRCDGQCFFRTAL